MKRISTFIVALFLLTASQVLAAEELSVIVNRDNNNTVDVALVKKIYLGSTTRWPLGGTVVVLDLPEDSPATASFAAKVIGKSVLALRDLWAQNVFTGRALPPKVLASDEEVVKMVARSKNAIGYVRSSSADKRVKVVLTVR